MKQIPTSMRWSLAASILILFGGSWMAKRKAANSIRSANSKQSATVSATAEPEAPASAKKNEPTSAPPTVPDMDMATVLVAAADADRSKAEGRRKTEEEMARELAMVKHIRSLSPSQLQTLINQAFSTPELGPEHQKWLFSFSISALAITSPDLALELLKSHFDKVGDTPLGLQVPANIFVTYLKSNPKEAFKKLDEWIETHPDLNRATICQRIVNNLPAANTQLALELIRRHGEPLGFDTTCSLLKLTVGHCSDEATSRDIIAHLHGYKDRLGENPKWNQFRDDMLGAMARNIGKGDYDATFKWMDQMGFNREEYLATGLRAANTQRKEQTGRWLDWIGREVPGESITEEKKREVWGDQVRFMISTWAEKDSIAPAKWLEAQPPSVLKNCCICGYAQEIGTDYPETAAQWVMRLESENDRKTMLNRIYERGHFKTSEEAEVYAKKYGIE